MQPPPGAFEGFEVLVVEDKIHLLGELAVNFGDNGLDRLDGVVGNQRGGADGLLGQRLHGELDGAFGFVRLGLEFLVQQRVELA